MRPWATMLLTLCWLLGLAAPSLAQTWTEHRPPGAGFRVEFPGVPTTSEQDVPIRTGSVRARMATVELGDRSFIVAHTVYPAGTLAADREWVLDKSRDGGLQKAQGKLRTERRLTVGGVPARRVVIDVPDRNQSCLALIVLSGDRLMQSIACGPSGSDGSADFQRFVSSFALVAN